MPGLATIAIFHIALVGMRVDVSDTERDEHLATGLDVLSQSIHHVNGLLARHFEVEVSVVRLIGASPEGADAACEERLGAAGEKSNEDARFVLPNAAATRLVMTMNARELMHFFSLRCCNRAQWEIREMAWQMLALCKQAAPALFEHAGPACVSGACPEGKNTCGKAAEVREKAGNL